MTVPMDGAISKAAFLAQARSDAALWDAAIAQWDRWEEKAQPASKAEFHAWQRDFHSRRADVHRRLRLLDSGPNNAWDDVRDAEVAAWTELQAAFTSAAIRYG